MAALWPRPADAGGGPENVLLLVNADHPDSVAVAGEYSRLRSIPAANVLALRGLPATTRISLDQFRELILKPALEAIQKRGLASQIDYIVYSAGFPFQIDVSADMTGRKYPVYITQPASLTGLTFLYQLALEGGAEYLALDANWYFRRLKSTRPDSPWTAEDKRCQSELLALMERLQAPTKPSDPPSSGQRQALLAEAGSRLQELRQRHPNEPNLLYDLGCILALQGKPDEALEMLREAHRAGWRSAGLAEADPDLQSLHGRADFRELLDAMRKTAVEMNSPRPFRHSRLWSPAGEHVAAGGRQYYLSAMLAYTGSGAATLNESLENLRRSASADATRPAGTVYYMISSDRARTGPREWGFRPAAEALKSLGVKAEVLAGVLPPGKPDVAGVAIGIAGFDWKGSGSKILPGAFCDHLTSFGGVMTGAGQTLLSEFLRNGAAGASGTVTEPYAIQAKFPNPFLHVYYASGCSLAEAFYQSVQAPYQQLLVGDPLCRPWARVPIVSLTGLKPGGMLRKKYRLIPRAASGEPVVRFELYVDGIRRQNCAPGGSLILDPAGLDSGEHEARVVALCGPIEATGRLLVPFRVANR